MCLDCFEITNAGPADKNALSLPTVFPNPFMYRESLLIQIVSDKTIDFP